MQSWLVALVAFAAMEPVTYAAHRWLMHGLAERLHRSHHRNAARATAERWEANDIFPLAFGAVVVALMAAGFNVAGWGVLVPACIGITTYGTAYAAVHDLYIHRRFIRSTRRLPGLERLAEAHRTHHRTNGEPYGMLLPVVPRTQRSGLRPSHEPVDA
jgi:beta-carotene 3-hydroxylase